jgi:Cellulose binding domain/Glycosyl hydrolase family 12
MEITMHFAQQLIKKRLMKSIHFGLLALSCCLTIPETHGANGAISQIWSRPMPMPGQPEDPSVTLDDLVNPPEGWMFNRKGVPSWGYPNLPIPSDGTTFDPDTGNAAGNYRYNHNFWNKNIVVQNVHKSMLYTFVDDKTGYFKIVDITSTDPTYTLPNSYYPGIRPQSACNLGSDPTKTGSQDPCHWTPEGNHAPASYPSIYNGCHYDQCTKPAMTKEGVMRDGGPYPIQVRNITSIPSHWVVDTSKAKSTAVFDVAYDIWLDRNSPRDAAHKVVNTGTPPLPDSPHVLYQNDGLEIMIWINNKGYTQGGVAKGGIIQPSGTLVTPTPISIPGVAGKWDVWVTDKAKLSNQYAGWYVVSYVRVDGVDDFEFDSKWFINDAAGRDCVGGEKCASPDWWLTSIQAGFEVWADGDGLLSKTFTAQPTWLPAVVQGGRTGKDPAGNTVPVVYWGESFDVTASCPAYNANDTATFTFKSKDPSTGIEKNLIDVPMTRDITGVFHGTVTAPYPSHDWATVTITTNCSGVVTVQPPINVFIDPAGTVKDTKGNPIVGAKVTLYRSGSANGTFTMVPDGDKAIMSDKNRKNPDFTGQHGNFSWDVIAGFYKVRAEATGCYKPGNSAQTYVESAVYQVPPPALGIDLVLECPGKTGSVTPGVTTKLTVNGKDWAGGYCRNLELTNTTKNAINWVVKFDLPKPGNISQTWNITYSKSGNTVTASGIGWNDMIKPGEVLKNQGFCVTK